MAFEDPVDHSNATIEERTFYRGLLEETDPKDYDEAAIDSALVWLKTNPPQPFVLFIPLFAPHPPFQVKDPYYHLYRELDLPQRVKLSEKTGFEPLFMSRMREEYGLQRATEEHWKEIKAVYVSHHSVMLC